MGILLQATGPEAQLTEQVLRHSGRVGRGGGAIAKWPLEIGEDRPGT